MALFSEITRGTPLLKIELKDDIMIVIIHFIYIVHSTQRHYTLRSHKLKRKKKK